MDIKAYAQSIFSEREATDQVRLRQNAMNAMMDVYLASPMRDEDDAETRRAKLKSIAAVSRLAEEMMQILGLFARDVGPQAK